MPIFTSETFSFTGDECFLHPVEEKKKNSPTFCKIQFSRELFSPLRYKYGEIYFTCKKTFSSLLHSKSKQVRKVVKGRITSLP